MRPDATSEQNGTEFGGMETPRAPSSHKHVVRPLPTRLSADTAQSKSPSTEESQMYPKYPWLVYSQYASADIGMVKPPVPDIHIHAPSTIVESAGQLADGTGVGTGIGVGVGGGNGLGGGDGTGVHFELVQVSCVQDTNRGSSDLCKLPQPVITGVLVHLSP